MRTQIKATNITLTDTLSAYVYKRLEPLEKYFGRDSESAIVDVELAKTTAHHQSGDIYRAEFNIHVGKNTFRAAKETSDIFTSIDEVRSQMEDELRGRKGKTRSLLRHGGARIKEIIRGITRRGY